MSVSVSLCRWQVQILQSQRRLHHSNKARMLVALVARWEACGTLFLCGLSWWEALMGALVSAAQQKPAWSHA